MSVAPTRDDFSRADRARHGPRLAVVALLGGPATCPTLLETCAGLDRGSDLRVLECSPQDLRLLGKRLRCKGLDKKSDAGDVTRHRSAQFHLIRFLSTASGSLAAFASVLGLGLMSGVWAKLTTLALLAMSAACGNTESKQPQEPASSGGGGTASGGSGGGGGTPSTIQVCPNNPGDGHHNSREERYQLQGTNGTFEDHCDDAGQLVEYWCISRVPCSGPSCMGDATVSYPTGEVGPYTSECACVDGVCPPL